MMRAVGGANLGRRCLTSLGHFLVALNHPITAQDRAEGDNRFRPQGQALAAGVRPVLVLTLGLDSCTSWSSSPLQTKLRLLPGWTVHQCPTGKSSADLTALCFLSSGRAPHASCGPAPSLITIGRHVNPQPSHSVVQPMGGRRSNSPPAH